MAGTVIDELIVTLGLDPSNYTKGQKDAAKSLLKTRQEAEKTAKEMERRGKEAAAFFTKIRNEALATFAVLAIGGGITGFVERSIKSLSDLGYASENLGMSAKRLDGWERAAQRAGGTAQGMAAQLKQSADAVAAFHMGMSSPDVDWFFRAHGNKDTLKDAQSYLLERSRIIHDLFVKDPTQAAYVASKMGISGDTFNFLKQGPAAVRAQIAAQEKLSNATKDNVDAARALAKEYFDIHSKMESVEQALVIKMFPLFKEFSDWLMRSADWLLNNKTEIKAWADEAVSDAREFAHAANDVAQAVGGWKTVLEALLLLKVSSFVKDMLSLGGALTKVGAALNTTVLAGTVGWMIGTYIRNHLSADTQDKIGAGVAHVLDFFGNKEAHDALNIGKLPDRQKYIMQRLLAMGFTPMQAAAQMGSWQQESGLDPTAVNPKSHASGIAQWTGSREREFVRMYGTTPDKAPLKLQMDFIAHEYATTYKKAADAIRRANTLADATVAHRKYYEQPGADEANDNKRIAYANSIYNAYGRGSALTAARAAAVATTAYTGYNWQTTHNTSSAETHIGKVEIHTLATDADSIAREAGDAFSKYNTFASQANTGLVG